MTSEAIGALSRLLTDTHRAQLRARQQLLDLEAREANLLEPSTVSMQPAPQAPYNRNIWSPLDRGIQHSTQDNVGRWCRLRVYRNHCELTRFDPLRPEAPTTTATFTSPEAARLDAERWLNFEGCMHDL